METPRAPEPAPAPLAPDPGAGRRRGARPGSWQAAQAAAVDALRELGAPPLPPFRSPIHCLTIIGQIEGHMVLPPHNKTTKYEHVLPQLVAVEQSPEIEGLLVLLNTVGGDVEAGLAIAEVVATMSKPTVSVVLGGGHSIGVPIAVAADYSFIASTATMTIHPIRMSGVVIGVPQSCEYLAKMQDRVVRFIVQNARISEERFRALMFRTGELARDVGTILVGAEAVREGLIDEVGGVDRALAKLKELISRHRGGREAGDGRRAAPGGKAGEPGAPGTDAGAGQPGAGDAGGRGDGDAVHRGAP